MTFGNRLLMILRKKGCTQKELTQKAGISATTISNLVHGHTLPKQSTMQKIAAALEVDTSELGCNTEYGMPAPKVEKLLKTNADALAIYLDDFKNNYDSYTRITNLVMLLNQRAGYLAALELLKEE